MSILPIVLLLLSNVFMTFAWYGHLKFTDCPLWLVVIFSWGIAFIEYCFAVPANRYGFAVYSPSFWVLAAIAAAGFALFLTAMPETAERTLRKPIVQPA